MNDAQKDDARRKTSSPPVWLAAATALAVISIITTGASVYFMQRDVFNQSAIHSLEAVSRLKVDQVTAWKAERTSDANRVTNSIGSPRVAEWLADPRTLDRSLVTQWLSAAYDPGYYTGAAIVNVDGEIEMVTGKTISHIDEPMRQAIDMAANTGWAQLTDPYITEEAHNAQMHLVAPLFDSFAEDRQFVGAVILCMNAERTLFPLLAVDPLGSRTAESVLVRREGEYSRFLNDPRHVDNEDLSLKIPLTRTGVPAVMAAMGETGIVRGDDYRGIPVLAHMAAVPGTNWKIVTKIDEAEVFAGWRVEGWFIGLFSLGLAVSAVGSASLLWQKMRFTRLEAVFETERERLMTERELIASEQRLSLVAEVSSHGFWDYGIRTGEISTSRSFATMLGYDPDTFVETYPAWKDRLHPEDRERVLAELQSYIDGKSPEYKTVFRAKKADSGRMWIMCVGTITDRDENGAPLRMLGIDTDITALKEVQIEAATSRQLLQNILDTVPVRVFWKDRDSRYLGCNQPFAMDSGHTSPEELLGKSDYDMSWVEQADLYRADDRRVMDTGAILLGYEEPQTSAEGRSLWLRTSKVPLRDETGDIIGVLGTYEDITAEKLAKLELARLNENLEQLVDERTEELSEALEELQAVSEDLMEMNEQLTSANEAKTLFLRSMSHELRTPLNSVIGFSSLMLQGATGPITDEQRKQLEMINHSGKHLLELINDILDLSRIEAGRVELRFSVFSVDKLLQELVASIKPLADSKSLALTYEISDPDLILSSDHVRVRQILLNLCSNAVKFSDEGSVTVRAWRRAESMIAISVTDTGCGIPAEDQELIFEEFSKVHRQSNPEVEGTGLGLAISRRLAVHLGGSVNVESKPGAGSTFTLLLPEKPATIIESS